MFRVNRIEALELLKKYNSNESLLKHAYAVEAVMRYFAKLKDEDVEYWGNIGLIHDLDYEMYPDQHCEMTKKILEERNVAEDIIRAIMSHGYGLCTEIEPERYMEKVLYTIDELTGLVTATVLMRPDKSIEGLEVKSVMKKFKTSKFAAGVNRDVILKGCTMIEMELPEVIAHVISGMTTASDAIGL